MRGHISYLFILGGGVGSHLLLTGSTPVLDGWLWGGLFDTRFHDPLLKNTSI